MRPLLLFACFVIAILVVQVASATPAEAAELEVEPSSVTVGEEIEIEGMDFVPGEKVKLCLDQPGCAQLGQVEADGDGEIEVTVSIANDVSPGPHRVYGCQAVVPAAQVCASAALTVANPATTTTTTVPTTTSTTAATTTTTVPTTTSTTAATPTSPGAVPPTSPPGSTTTTPASPTTESSAPEVSDHSANQSTPSSSDTTTTSSTSPPYSPPSSDESTELVPGFKIGGPGGADPTSVSGDSVATSADSGNAPGTNIGWGQWLLVAMAAALAALVLWLVDLLGSPGRRSEHLRRSARRHRAT